MFHKGDCSILYIIDTSLLPCLNEIMEKNPASGFQSRIVLKHSLLLILVVIVIFGWAISPYQTFGTQIVATLFALFLTKHFFRDHLTTQRESLIDSLILTALVLVIVTATGGLSSPLFFLVYFLLFILSLLLEPTIPLILAFSLIVYFLFASPINKIAEMIPLFSFPLITPLAVYFGREHKRNIYHKHDNLHLKESIRRETEDVLFWLTTTFAREMSRIAESLEQFPYLTDAQKPYLNNIKNAVFRLKKLGERLKEAIEED